VSLCAANNHAEVKAGDDSAVGYLTPGNPQKITFREMREMGVRGVLIYCADYRCGRHSEANADSWADAVRLSDIEPKFVCTKCGSAAPTCGRTSNRPRWAPPPALLPAFAERDLADHQSKV
jgi:hypothetical protein